MKNVIINAMEKKPRFLIKILTSLVFALGAWILYDLGETYFVIGGLATSVSAALFGLSSDLFSKARSFLYDQTIFTLTILILFLTVTIIYPLKNSKRICQ